jgi:hypothetical protein
VLLNILQRLPFSSPYHSPATTILQRLPFSSACHSLAPTILQRLPFSSDLPEFGLSAEQASPKPVMR